MQFTAKMIDRRTCLLGQCLGIELLIFKLCVSQCLMQTTNFPASPLDDPGKKEFSLHPRGTKVVIYHLVGNFMLNSMQNVVSLATCAESL